MTMNDATPDPLRHDPNYAAPLAAAGEKTPVPNGVHIDIGGTTHVDIARPHVDVPQVHADTPLHADAPQGPYHVDTALGHVDLVSVPHIDMQPPPHLDTPVPPHIDSNIQKK
jgi:hypothetical protein